MPKFKVVLCASYIINADNGDDAVHEAFEECRDEIGDAESLEKIFGSNVEEIGGDEE